MNPFTTFRSQYSRCIVIVADGARYDETKRRLYDDRLPNIKKHIVDRGSLQRAISVFPSTTGPAHIPFVSGVHPGTANITGYRWLDRQHCDSGGKKSRRFRSLNSPRGLFMGCDMTTGTPSLFNHFERPSAIVEPVDLCGERKLFNVRFRRLAHVLYAHTSDDWIPFDRFVECTTLKRIRAGSECIVATFLGIDEYSHLGGPDDPRVGKAYDRIDLAVGRIADLLKKQGLYRKTILVVLSDHGQTGTNVHIPLVDFLHGHRFVPFHYPRRYSKESDWAVMESGYAMVQLYFRRNGSWGKSWSMDEMMAVPKIGRLIRTLTNTRGIPFVIARGRYEGVAFKGSSGILRARSDGDSYVISREGDCPVPEVPTGRITRKELFDLSFEHRYPDAIDQAFRLFKGSRSGDLLVCADPGYDLRLKNENPEHRGSHGSMHTDHMSVPVAISIPLQSEIRCTCDVPPTILAATGKIIPDLMEGVVRRVNGQAMSRVLESAVDGLSSPEESDIEKRRFSARTLSILVTVSIMLGGLMLTALYQTELLAIGGQILQDYGPTWMDGVLFVITAVSSTPLFLPIWGYALVGISMGYGVIHLAIVMALGSATGSLVTYFIGKYLGDTGAVKRRFPKISEHPWTEGKPRSVTTLLLFLGTASPIPCDVLYASCGFKIEISAAKGL